MVLLGGSREKEISEIGLKQRNTSRREMVVCYRE